ncbi:MAG TPA: radical SAM protein, partial [Coleofasciculaceae cyanobacterium]
MQVLDRDLNVAFDAELIQKYNCSLPRYTSYPPATELSPDFPAIDWVRSIHHGNDRQTPLSLYCHIPFCETACYFCGCNTVITQHKAVAETYLDYLTRHIEQVSNHLSSDRLVNQMHWGGGTPNYLSIEQVEQLWTVLQRHFQFAPDAELSIEVNPRPLTRDYISALRSLGFNRISFGIQDFNPIVQEAINR